VGRKFIIISLSVILVALVAVPSSTAAMGARINSNLTLTSTGVHVTGTFSHWDANEVSARISTCIDQGYTQSCGVSKVTYQNGAKTWQAYTSGIEHVGKAVGHATATITNSNGTTEKYSWTVDVTLGR
jgi:hypothetical protein